jgi:hypothetical protein
VNAEGQSLGVEDSHWIKEDMCQWIFISRKMQRRDERKLRVEINEPQISEGTVTIDPKGNMLRCIMDSG